jgi:hypothetical protein
MPAVKKWFKAKNYGYGWAPQTFEGWLTTLIYIVLVTVVTVIFILRLNDPLFDQWVSVGIYLFLLGFFTVALIIIAYKTGEKPSWRWGKKKKNN